MNNSTDLESTNLEPNIISQKALVEYQQTRLSEYPQTRLAELVEPPPKSLAEQRMDLQLRLQINRRLLINKFSGEAASEHFPRSTLMRFLTQHTTVHLLKKLAFTAIGVKTITSIKYGYSLWKFARHKFLHKQ